MVGAYLTWAALVPLGRPIWGGLSPRAGMAQHPRLKWLSRF